MMRRQFTKLRKNVIGVLLLATAIVSTIAIGLTAAYLNRTNPQLGPDGCPVGVAPSAEYAVLVDGSDPLDDLQREFILKHIQKWAYNVEKYGRVRLFALDPQNGIGEAAFNQCHPGAGDDATFLFSNPPLLKKKFKEWFDDPLNDALRDLGVGSAVASPIMKGIQRLTVKVFMEPLATRELLLVSDLLEHTEQYSHYRDECHDASGFLGDRYFADNRADMRGVRVRILYVVRTGAAAERCQGRSHTQFWDHYFTAQGATVEEVVRVPGSAPSMRNGS